MGYDQFKVNINIGIKIVYKGIIILLIKVFLIQMFLVNFKETITTFKIYKKVNKNVVNINIIVIVVYDNINIIRNLYYFFYY